MRGKLRGLTGRASRIASRPAHRLELSQVSVHHFREPALDVQWIILLCNALQRQATPRIAQDSTLRARDSLTGQGEHLGPDDADGDNHSPVKGISTRLLRPSLPLAR